VELLIDFIYLGDYNNLDLAGYEVENAGVSHAPPSFLCSYAGVGEPGSLEVCARMYSLASKYDLPELKIAAVTKHHQTMHDISWGSTDPDSDIRNGLPFAIAIAHRTGGQREAEMRKAVVLSIVNNLKLALAEKCIWDSIVREKELTLDIMTALANHCSCHNTYPGFDPLGTIEACVKCGKIINYRWTRCQGCYLDYPGPSYSQHTHPTAIK
jgi:hypothetical protein